MVGDPGRVGGLGCVGVMVVVHLHVAQAVAYAMGVVVRVGLGI
jgi:hypothetical protein